MTEIMLVNPSGRSVRVKVDPSPQFFEAVLGGRVHTENTNDFTIWYSLDEKDLGTRLNLPVSLFYYRWTGDVKSFYGPVALTGRSPYGVPYDLDEKYFLSMEDYCYDHRRKVY